MNSDDLIVYYEWAKCIEFMDMDTSHMEYFAQEYFKARKAMVQSYARIHMYNRLVPFEDVI